MKRFVLDCSATMAWCFEDEASSEADAALDALVDGQAIVPGIWSLEVANVLTVAERRGRVTAAEVSRFVDLLLGLPIVTDAETSSRALGDILMLARTYELSAYDAAYLELAMRLGVGLVTKDRSLANAAARAGVPSGP